MTGKAPLPPLSIPGQEVAESCSIMSLSFAQAEFRQTQLFDVAPFWLSSQVLQREGLFLCV